MKRDIFLLMALMGLLLVFTPGCTDDFESTNRDPNAFDETSVNPALFVSNVLQKTFVPNRFPYWRGPLIHADRFCDFYRFGFSESWWDDGLGYEYNNSYTDAWWSESFKAVPANINELLRITDEGGSKENKYLHAVGKICRAIFFQRMTDAFGEMPFIQAGKIDFPTPKYDTQKDIYTAIMAELGEAIEIIGNETSTGGAGFDLADGDVIYQDGDLQQWKKMANTLRLRMAMRARGAEEAGFVDNVIEQCLQNPLLEEDEDFAKIYHDLASTWDANSLFFIWWDFGWTNAARFTVSQTLIDLLRNNNDPRLPWMAKPAEGGEFKFVNVNDPDFQEKLNIIISILDNASVDYETTTDADTTWIEFEENKFYIGQPARFNSAIQSFIKFKMFSHPSDYIVGETNQVKGRDIAPQVVITVAESYFLQAEAALKGLSNGNANQLYQEGLRASLRQWKVEANDIEEFMNEPIANLSGSDEEKLGQIATQRWLANYPEGFEAWAVLRDTGHPAAAAAPIPNTKYYESGTVGPNLPQRMRYPASEENLNPDNVQEAISRQGENTQKTKLWYVK